MTTGDLAKAVLAILPPRGAAVEHGSLSPEGQVLRARLGAATLEYLASEQYKKDAEGKPRLQRPLWTAEAHKTEDEELRARVAKLRLEKELPF